MFGLFKSKEQKLQESFQDAIFKRDYYTAADLVEEGANIHTPLQEKRVTQIVPIPPLIYALRYALHAGYVNGYNGRYPIVRPYPGAKEFIDILIENGADVKEKHNGKSPLLICLNQVIHNVGFYCPIIKTLYSYDQDTTGANEYELSMLTKCTQQGGRRKRTRRTRSTRRTRRTRSRR